MANKKGIALIFNFIIIVILTILGVAVLSRSISENRIAQKSAESAQAFWLAEAGISQAVDTLRGNYTATSIANTSLGPGGYNGTISGTVVRTVTAYGCIPADCTCAAPPNNCRVTRIVQADMIQYQNIPPQFYNNPIYSAGNVSIGGDCVVNGNVFSGGAVTGSVNGTITQNDSTLHNNGLPALSFEDLRQTSINQGWYNPVTNTTTFPATFWNVAPSPDNPIGVPNVVFVNGDFGLVGGNQVVKGFIVVGGDTIYNAEIGGNATVDGCIYTRGNIWLHGGGGNRINVNGGVWAGGTISMEGNQQIDFNQDYMNGIRDGLHPNTDVRITAWRDMQNPYQ